MTAGRAAFAALCAYEAAAVATGRVPTVSQWCRRRRWAQAALLAALLLHLQPEGVSP